MNIYIPIAPGLGRNNVVYNYAITQRHCSGVAYCVAGEPIQNVQGIFEKKMTNISLSRNACLDAGAVDKVPFVVLDNDCELIGDDNLLALEAALIADDSNVAAFLRVNKDDWHHRNGCVIYSPKFIELGFRYRFRNKCECQDMQEQVLAAGYKLAFVEGVRLINTMRHKLIDEKN